MSIKSVMVFGIDSKYTAEYIANVLWRHNIAQVSSVTLLPYVLGSRTFQTAYIGIATWADSEIAYNLIQRLKDKSKNPRIVHKDDLWWRVQINNHGQLDKYEKSRTIIFPARYFIKTDDNVQFKKQRISCSRR